MIIDNIGTLKEFLSSYSDDAKIRISEGMCQYPIKASTRFTVVESETPHTVISVELESYKNS